MKITGPIPGVPGVIEFHGEITNDDQVRITSSLRVYACAQIRPQNAEDENRTTDELALLAQHAAEEIRLYLKNHLLEWLLR